MRTRTLMIVTAALLACGLAADLLLTRPALARTRRLAAQRESALKRFDQLRARDDERRLLAAVLDVERLPELAGRGAGPDGVVFLGEALATAGLARLELSTHDTVETQHLRRSRYSLLARGGYAQVLAFLRDLESSDRLVTVDVLKIERVVGGDGLECRLNISVFDAREGAAS